MEPGYVGSREFWIALGIGLLVLSGATATAVWNDGAFDPFFGGVPCVTDWDLPDEVPVDETAPHQVDARVERTITYHVAVSAPELKRLSVCTTVGGITVESHNGTVVEVEVRASLRGSDKGPVADFEPEVHRRDAEGTELYVHVPHPPRHDSILKDRHGQVDVHVRVPAGMEIRTLRAYGDVGPRSITDVTVDHLDVHVDVGLVRLQDVTVRGTTELHTDVGDVLGSGLGLHGTVVVHTDTGDVDLRVDNVSTARWRVFTDVGDVSVSVPLDERIGYDLHLDCDVGAADADIGPTETRDRRSSGASDHLVVRSAGYDARAVQVDIRVVTDVGSVTVVGR